MDNIKKCTKCQGEKSLSEFWNKKTASDGKRSKCITCEKQENKKYQIKNKEVLSRKAKIASIKNKKRKSEYFKNWWAKNKHKKIKKSTEYKKDRYHSDELFKLSELIRGSCKRITKAIKKNKNMRSLEYLGCTLEEFKKHIESQWQEGMAWDNHSLDGWHIDHIVPIDWYIKNSDDPWEANHYTNLQPLWAKENLSKNNKIK